MMDRLMANLNRQIERSWRAIICLHSIQLPESIRFEIEKDQRIKILSFDTGASLGGMLNRAIWEVDTPFVCKWDDDDYYGKWFLSETLDASLKQRGELIGKASWYAWIEDNHLLYSCFPGSEDRLQTYLAGGTLAGRTELFRSVPFIEANLGEDQTLVRDVIKKGGRVWATSKYGYVHVRSNVNHGHAWNVALADYLKGSKYVASSLDLKMIEGNWNLCDFQISI